MSASVSRQCLHASLRVNAVDLCIYSDRLLWAGSNETDIQHTRNEVSQLPDSVFIQALSILSNLAMSA